MVKVVFDNCFGRIEGALHYDYSKAEELHRLLRFELSYMIPNADYSPMYKEELWDGRISLYRKSGQKFPTGLTYRVIEVLKANNIPYIVSDQRTKPKSSANITCDFGNKELRFYQTESAERALKSTRGIIAIGTGGGKTMTSCHLISKINVAPLLFFVPSLSLLKQTRKSFQETLLQDGKPAFVGIAGDSECELNFKGVNVITYQTALAAYNQTYSKKDDKVVDSPAPTDESPKTRNKTNEQLEEERKAAKRLLKKATDKAESSLGHLVDEIEEKRAAITTKGSKLQVEKLEREYQRQVKALTKAEAEQFKKADDALTNRKDSLERKAKIRKLIESSQSIIFDEAHTAAAILEAVSNYAVNAYYKHGCTATAWRTDNQEIRMEGALGRKLIEVTSSDLIDLGYLVPLTIYMAPVKFSAYGKDYATIYERNITKCWHRNYLIKCFAEELKERGIPTLILVERKDHGDELERLIQDSVFVKGGDSEDDPDDAEKDYRRRMLNACEKNEIILIATQWANVGIDAPKLRGLILAGSCKSSVTTYQQLGRVIRLDGHSYEQSVANGKPDAIVIDFYDEQDSMRKHSNQRKNVYRRERNYTLINLR